MGNWIKEIFDCSENTVYVNYERGEGVTTGILKEILSRDYNIVLMDQRHFLRIIKDKYKELTGRLILKENYTEGYIVLENDKGNEVKIYCHSLDKNVGGKRIDLVIMDSTRYTIPDNAFSFGCKVICVLPERAKVINSDKKLEKTIKNNELNRTQVVENEIDKLLKELSNAKCDKDTTMTRERLISMIERMVGVRKELSLKSGDVVG